MKQRSLDAPSDKVYWIEEYVTCGCSTVERKQKDLPGYCPTHGTDRANSPQKIYSMHRLVTGTKG